MGNTLLQFIKPQNLADLSSTIGLPLTIAGLIYTMITAYKAKSASQRTEEEVKKLRDNLQQMETIADLSIALSLMEEIKRLHRFEAWAELVERYATLRRKLVGIRTANPLFNSNQKDVISGAVTLFRSTETRIERFLQSRSTGPGRNPSVANLNRMISEQMDVIEEILTSIKLKIGE